MAPTRSAMFWAKSREIVDSGEAGKELEGLRRGEGGARRRREKGCGETVRTNLLGGTPGRAPPPENLLAQATAHAAVKKAPPSTSGAWGEGEEGVANPGGGALRRPRSRGARGAVAPHGDVRSSWSRGLPPAADVRTVNNRERSVEGGIPRRSVRRPSSRTPPRPGLLRSPGCWGRGEGERGVLRREAAAQARVARGAASSPDLSSRSRAAASQLQAAEDAAARAFRRVPRSGFALGPG